jgi:thiamine transport system substrate-binding protein
VTTGRTVPLLLTLALVAACGGDDADTAATTSVTSAPTTATQTTPEAAPQPESLTILSHDSFTGGVTDETFASFTDETGIEVEVIGGGDAGGAVNQAILTKDNPIADVLFGVDDTFLSRALDEELFVPHQSELLDVVDPTLMLDDQNRVTPIDYGDVCLNYDIGWFEDEPDLDPPDTLDDLVAPEYGGLLVVEDPARSSPGLAFLLATVERFGSEWPGYWESLAANEVNVAADWDTAYYSDFTRYDGDDPIVVSYASSPPAEVMFADPPVDTAPTGVVTDGCYRQTEFAGILEGTEHPEAAGQLIDFMLSPEFQQAIPTTWFVFPANTEVELPEVFTENTVIPDDPISMNPQEIGENRERWLTQWREAVEP